MNRNEISQKIFEDIFKKYSVKLSVVLRSSKTQSENFDKFRNVGYSKTYKNPLFVNAITKPISENSLIIREIGLSESGAIKVIVADNDIPLLKLSEKIEKGTEEYTPWNKALGNRFQVFPSDYVGYSIVILFKLIK